MKKEMRTRRKKVFSLLLAVVLTISTFIAGQSLEVRATENKEITLKFDENVNGTFYFSGDRTGVTGNELFYGKIIVDGNEIGMFFTPDGDRYVIANSWLGAKAPENTFQIIAGTEFKQLNSWADQSEKTDGITLTIANTLTVEKKGYEWIEARETANLNKALHLEAVNEGSEVKFITDITDIPSGYYTTVVNIDGKECKVPIQRSASSGKFVIWYNMFTLFGGTKPTESLVIPKGTILRQVDTSQNWSVITDGAWVELTNTLMIQKVDGQWTEIVETTKKELHFDTVNEGAEWKFRTDMSDITSGVGFMARVLIDGNEYQIRLSQFQGQFVVWWTSFNGNVPTSSFEIPKGSILKQVNSDGSIATGGQWLETTNALKVEKKGYEWIEARETANLNKALHLEAVNEGSEVKFITDITDIPSGYYTTVVNIDGKECKVPIQRSASSGKFVIWYNMFTALGGSKPTKSLVIPAGAILRQVDTSQNWSVITDGAWVELANTLTIQKVDGQWTEIVETTKKELHFDTVNEGAEWKFRTDMSDITSGVGFIARVLIDGNEYQIRLSQFQGQFVVWWTSFNGNVPTSSFEIPKGSILKQVNSDGSITAGGQWIETTNTLKVEKKGYEWIEARETANIVKEITLNNVTHDEETGDSWFFNMDNTSDVTGTRFITTALVDGTPSRVIVGCTTDQDTGTKVIVMWPSDFKVVGKGQPTTSFEIPANAVLRQIESPDEVGNWHTLDPDGQWLELGKRLYAEKLGNGWGSYDTTEDSTATPIYECIDLEAYRVLSSTNAYLVEKLGIGNISSMDLNEVGTYTVDRIEENIRYKEKVVLYKTGDAHADGTLDVRDLVAMKKIAEGKDTGRSLEGQYAADIDRSENVDDIDLKALIRGLIGIETLAQSKGMTLLNGVMPIIGYGGPRNSVVYDSDEVTVKDSANTINDATYQLIDEVGINTVILYEDRSNDKETSFEQLKLAENHDLKVYLMDGYAGMATDIDVLSAYTAKYDRFRSFGGYLLQDEPLYTQLASHEKKLELMKGYTNISGYINLNPYTNPALAEDMGQPEGQVTTQDNYMAYVRAASQLGMDYISYDLYLRGRTDEGNDNKKKPFYNNLNWIRTVAKEDGKPFYAFVQAGNHFSQNYTISDRDVMATIQEMYFEANAALAMGAKGISYYPLVQNLSNVYSLDNSKDYYRTGLINALGNKNDGGTYGAIYDYFSAAKKINTYVAKIDEVLMNATSKAVMSTDSTVAGLLSNIPSSYGVLKDVTGERIMVGCFDYYGKDAYLVVNTSCDGGEGTGTAKTVTLDFDGTPAYKYIDMACAEKNQSGDLTLTIQAGESVLVVMQ